MSFSPQYLVAVNLVLLALAAYSASAIVGTTLAARLIPPPEVELNPPPPPIPEEAPKPSQYYSVIHQRDIFNSVKPETVAEAPKPVQVTPLKLKLWGVALHEDETSYAIIEDESSRDKKQGLYRVDEQVAETGATVKAVEWDRVVLTRNGQDEILELQKSTSVASAGVPGIGGGGVLPGAGRPRAAAPAAVPPVSDEHIQMIGENEFSIDRSEVDSALENMSQLFTQIRAVPHFEGGKSTGFRLFAIRSGSLFDKIGLKNGDIIQKINGNEMNDPSRALQLMQDLRNETDLNIDLTRNRQPLSIKYSIR